MYSNDPILKYTNNPNYQTVMYYLSTSASYTNGNFTQIPSTSIPISLPTYLTIQVAQVGQPICALTTNDALNTITTTLPPTPKKFITVAQFYITKDIITQSISYPSKSFTEILSSLTYNPISSSIIVNVTGYGWYRTLQSLPSLPPLPSPDSWSIYFVNNTLYDFEVDIADVNCSSVFQCTESKLNLLNIFDTGDGTTALTNFRVSAGMFYPFNMALNIGIASDVAIVVSGLESISQYTFTFPLHTEAFNSNGIFDATGEFVCKLAYSYCTTSTENFSVVSMS
jgi:hypothetical protein